MKKIIIVMLILSSLSIVSGCNFENPVTTTPHDEVTTAPIDELTEERAVEIATEHFTELQDQGIDRSYVFQSVHYDNDTRSWIVCYGPEILMPGACYYISVSKDTGEILDAWPGE